MEKSYKIYVDCANCANLMQHAAEKTGGIKSASVNFMTQEMAVSFEDGADEAEVMQRVYKNCKDVEEDCEIYLDGNAPEHEHGHNHHHHHHHDHEHEHDHGHEEEEPVWHGLTKKQVSSLTRIAVAAVFVLLSSIFEDNKLLSILFFAVAYLTAGYDVLFRAARGIAKGHPFDENFLMAVATIGSVGLGDYTEGAAVMIFYQIGELFESIAVGKSRRNIRETIDIRPDYANIVMPGGELERVSPDGIEPGSIIVVKPGEKVPIDGIITSGSSSVDVSALTGESMLKDVEPGIEILSGSINMTGVIEIRTTKAFDESTASKILNLVEKASSSKSKSEDFISKFARIYTPAVCYMAVALAVIPSVIGIISGAGAEWSKWLYRALTFLVISCPCALVISIPLSFFGGLGGAGRCGILIKGSNFMEPLARTSCVAFDKTGTMTKGVLEVCGVHHCPMEDEKLIEYAAHAESYSSHPISLAIQRKYGFEPDRERVSNVREISGEGVMAVVDGHEICCGNNKIMKRVGVEHIDCRSHGTVIHVSIDGIYSGHILVADSIKENSAAAVEKLKKLGVGKTVMLTGDSASTAKQVAEEIGIDEIYSELLPADKLEVVEKLLQETGKKESLVFVGDGINDAPVLARADVGIAMGGIGSDAAIEASDVVIMDDDPLKIAKAIKIARRCIRIVYENIWFAIGVKVLCLLLTAFGLAGMWAAIFADTGVLIIAVLNSIRALGVGK